MPRGRKKFALGQMVWDPLWKRWGYIKEVLPDRCYKVHFIGGLTFDLAIGNNDPTFFASYLDRCIVTFAGAVPVPYVRRNRRHA